MESVGAFPRSESDSLMVPQFLDQSLFPYEYDKGIPTTLVSSSFSPTLEEKTGMACINESLFCSLDNSETNGYSCNPGDFVSIPSIPTYFLGGFPVNNDAFMSMDVCMGIAGANGKNIENPHETVCSDIGLEASPCVNEGINDALALAREMFLSRKLGKAELERGHTNITDSLENARKRLRISRDAGSDGQTSCSYSLEDESKAFQAVTSKGKVRAMRSGATDPQSIYARKRRERINERLKILQNLVPNGTKVDISTMLEEAVHYVKFLQLQIKLLRSDELWMYAPLAYNGVDIGLYQKIFSQLLQK